MSSAESNNAHVIDYGPRERATLGALWGRHGRALLTLSDQAVVSLASFATNFLLLHHFASGAGETHYAYYTLALNLMIWVAEVHATLVFTPHTMLSPRMSGHALRRFHGSTLLHHFGVSMLASIATLIAGFAYRNTNPEWSHVLVILSAGAILIGLRNYARPYSFTAKKPHIALILDLAVSALQIGGIIALRHADMLNATTAVAMVAGAAALPSLIWLLLNQSAFAPSVAGAINDLKFEWPNTRWVFLSGMVWNAGMQLYPWLILLLGGTLEVALWGACYQLAAVANPLLMGLQNFTGPRIAEAYTERKREDFVSFVYRTALWTSILMIGPAVLLSVFADGALTWISNGKFHGHQAAITLLCAAITLQAITFTLSRGLFALHRADLDLYCNFGPLLLLLTGGTALTHAFGATGAAGSLLIAQLLSTSSRAVLFRYAASRHHQMRDVDPVPEEVRGSS
ncbi:MAG: hypothetical protein H7144_15335 [Burkholderiales bacterium]|nr:hypothetical protein [Phycisphaerae bacterium]